MSGLFEFLKPKPQPPFRCRAQRLDGLVVYEYRNDRPPGRRRLAQRRMVV